MRRSHKAPRHLFLATRVSTEVVATAELGELSRLESRLLTCPGHAGSARGRTALSASELLAPVFIASVFWNHDVLGVRNAQSLTVSTLFRTNRGKRVTVWENKLLANGGMPLGNGNLTKIFNLITKIKKGFL